MKDKIRVLVDARELIPNQFTGIGRVLIGIISALGNSDSIAQVVLGGFSKNSIPPSILNHSKVSVIPLPAAFISSEIALSRLSAQSFNLFISPYPKLPLFGCKCQAINIVHDVFYISHPAYRGRIRSFFDRYRLRRDLKRADLTWFDSKYSMYETERLTEFKSKNGKVRYPSAVDGCNKQNACLNKEYRS